MQEVNTIRKEKGSKLIGDTIIKTKRIKKIEKAKKIDIIL